MRVRGVPEIILILAAMALLAACIPDGLERAIVARLPRQMTKAPGEDLVPRQLEAEIVELVNQRRKALGLPSLKVDPVLTEVARLRSRDMAQRGYFAHRDPKTHALLFHELLLARGLDGGGENLFLTSVRAQHAPTCAVNWWMDSRLHYENLMRPSYRETGVGVVVHAGQVYVTQVFL